MENQAHESVGAQRLNDHMAEAKRSDDSERHPKR
jgi:hypothetical protein